MAKRKRKIRYVLQVAGVRRQLFSLRVSGDGTIVLALNHAEFAEEASARRIITQRFSLHPSKDSRDGGRLTMQTVSFESGPDTRIPQYRVPGPDGIAMLVFGRLCPNLDNERYNLKAGRADIVAQICPFDAAGPTFFYFVIAVDPSINPVIFSKERMNIFIAYKTNDLQIIVLYAFFAVPPLNKGEVVSMPTFREIEEKIPGGMGTSINSPSIGGLMSFVRGFREGMKLRLRSQIRDVIAPNGRRDRLLAEVDELLAIGHIPRLPE